LSSTCPEPAGPGGRYTRVIAHRGASGYLPEHSALAKSLAYGLGADFLEQDIVATKDARLVVLHDTFLDDISDVADRFPDRARDDGHYYVIDFAREELAGLCLNERRSPGGTEARYPSRFPFASPLFRIVDFEDEIGLIAGLNSSTGRRVGLYPEIKNPGWHRQHGIDLTRLVHEALERNRHRCTGPVFVQSFDADALERLRDEFDSSWSRIRLLTAADIAEPAGRADRLAGIAAYADGVGLPYQALIRIGQGGQPEPSPLVRELDASGLLVHPYTLRRDAVDSGTVGYQAALEFLIGELRVDAIFCDQPDDAIAVRDGSAV